MQICKTQLLPGWSCFPVSRYFLLSVCFLLIPQLIMFLFSRRRRPPTPPRPPIPQIPARPPIPPSQDRRFPCFRSVFGCRSGWFISWLQLLPASSCFPVSRYFSRSVSFVYSAANRFLLRQRRYRRHTTPPPPGNRRESCGREGPPPPRCWTARAGRRRQRCWAARAGRRRHSPMNLW